MEAGSSSLPPVSRFEQIKKGGAEPGMPPNSLPHILNRLLQIGLVDGTGMSEAPVSWAAIYAWSQVTAVEIQPWEARLMRTLSTEYIAERRRSESETCPPPWHQFGSDKALIQAELRMLDDVLG